VVLFGALLAIALRPDWPWWARALAALGGVAAAAIVVVALNAIRGRSTFAAPERVGFGGAVALVLLPAGLDLALGDRPGRAVLIGLVSVGVAAFSYALASMGVVAAIIELGRESVKGLRDTALIAARAMPPMLAVLLFLFLATEVWQTLGVVEGWRFGVVFTSFLVLGTTFLLGGLRGYRRGLVDSKPTPALAERAARTPAARLVSEGVTPVFPPLGRLARINLAVALLVSLGVRIAAVGLAIGVFLIGFGMLVVTRSTTASWTGLPAGDLNVLLSISVAGNDIVLTEPLVRVSVLLGAFAALYFTVAALADERNRREFIDDELERLEDTMAAWAYYRGAIGASPTAPAVASAP
jgi:hypothetical protein